MGVLRKLTNAVGLTRPKKRRSKKRATSHHHHHHRMPGRKANGQFKKKK
jgi:hypothetical protein